MNFFTTSSHYSPTEPKQRLHALFLVLCLLIIGVLCVAPAIMKLNHGFEKAQVKYARPVSNDELVNKTSSMARLLYELLEHSMKLVKRSLLTSLTSGTNSQNRSRWPESPDPDSKHKSNLEFPMWMSRLDRKLVGTSILNVKADIIVTQDGSGTVKTITEAINIAPDNSVRPIVILVKAGIYAENNLTVGITKKNLWFMGEGIGQTVITGKKSFEPGTSGTIQDTATFAIMGSGFVARGISFVNEAGPTNNQAVALLVAADCTVLYQCEVKGYQDTLFVLVNRQFYRECDIYGTVDFIFGNAQAVFQNCTIWARKPLVGQANTITAQDRADPAGVSGMSFHTCNIRATPDLEPVKSIYPTYLGRPWNTSSRVVYMESVIGDHVDPKGWIEWDGKPVTNKIYYGEYKNVGRGANTDQRVTWALHVNMTSDEAENFTPDKFLLGQDWIPATQVPYQGGLLV